MLYPNMFITKNSMTLINVKVEETDQSNFVIAFL